MQVLKQQTKFHKSINHSQSVQNYICQINDEQNCQQWSPQRQRRRNFKDLTELIEKKQKDQPFNLQRNNFVCKEENFGRKNLVVTKQISLRSTIVQQQIKTAKKEISKKKLHLSIKKDEQKNGNKHGISITDSARSNKSNASKRQKLSLMSKHSVGYKITNFNALVKTNTQQHHQQNQSTKIQYTFGNTYKLSQRNKQNIQINKFISSQNEEKGNQLTTNLISKKIQSKFYVFGNRPLKTTRQIKQLKQIKEKKKVKLAKKSNPISNQSQKTKIL